MVLLIVKIKHMAVTLPAMIMMVVTAKVAVEPLADQNLVMTVNLIGLLTDLNAVIQLGMSMALIV